MRAIITHKNRTEKTRSTLSFIPVLALSLLFISVSVFFRNPVDFVCGAFHGLIFDDFRNAGENAISRLTVTGILYAEELPEAEENRDLRLPVTLSSSESDLYVETEPLEAQKFRVAIPEPPKPPVQKTDKPIDTAPASGPKNPETKKPVFKANAMLSIPEDAKDASFLEGCWTYGSNLMNDYREIKHVYCFDANGNSEHYIDEINPDGTNYDNCVNTAKARLSGRDLIIDANGPICRVHNTKYQDTYVKCSKAPNGSTQCYGTNVNSGTKFYTSFTYLGKSRG
jgi:hypothetical protein